MCCLFCTSDMQMQMHNMQRHGCLPVSSVTSLHGWEQAPSQSRHTGPGRLPARSTEAL